ncbi:hypothetical protein V1506DRAFT_546419 [Lipomyces tetrasporus]
MVLGLLTIAAIPTVVGISEATSAQKKQNAAAKFNLTPIFYPSPPSYLQGDWVVTLQEGRLWIEREKEVKGHRFNGFYFEYPPEPGTNGLVSSIQDDPPMLNWIYVDKDGLCLRYGSKSDSMGHIIGHWDWTEDEEDVTLRDDEGFVVVEEEDRRWGVYFDVNGDGSGLPSGRTTVGVSLTRKIALGVESKYIRD